MQAATYSRRINDATILSSDPTLSASFVRHRQQSKAVMKFRLTTFVPELKGWPRRCPGGWLAAT